MEVFCQLNYDGETGCLSGAGCRGRTCHLRFTRAALCLAELSRRKGTNGPAALCVRHPTRIRYAANASAPPAKSGRSRCQTTGPCGPWRRGETAPPHSKALSPIANRQSFPIRANHRLARTKNSTCRRMHAAAHALAVERNPPRTHEFARLLPCAWSWNSSGHRWSLLPVWRRGVARPPVIPVSAPIADRDPWCRGNPPRMRRAKRPAD